jgi:hypothetical protein
MEGADKTKAAVTEIESKGGKKSLEQEFMHSAII